MPDNFANYSTWLHTLPVIVQPVVTAFTPCLPLWLAASIFDRTYEARNGAPLAVKKISGWALLPLGLGVYYLRNNYPLVRAVVDYPDNHWPMWHQHWWQMGIGCLLAAVVAKWISALYAAAFLRSRRYRGGAGPVRVGVIDTSGYNMLPDPPPGLGWYHAQPKTRTRVVRTRTYNEE